ncbi:MAG: hypothetical protein A2W91_18070 [Bacteroidetes bacterium GWF2_38_335]|nr:MAG: hypothetical protein A2W91_18070 [Bacteroidetes bacterium GWF2_38_335]OFY80126.1 MAG: hypothetical protein A2281_12570 [Bacteroidetes bacterium RIFOXYA12_FULL_38_20]HBS88547.1 DUF1573 domain-containing protein [Bacteroidales bacterium]
MKKAVLSILLLLLFAVCSVGQQLQANISFEKESHNFGTIKEEEGPVTYKFEFTNTGSEPLIISKVRASCGCTTPDWTKEPIAPGGKGVVSAKYNPEKRPGKFDKTVTVESNALEPTKILRISGDVIAKPVSMEDVYRYQKGDLRLKNDHVAFTKIGNDEFRTESTDFINSGQQPVKITFADVPEHIKIVADPETVAPGGEGKIIVTYDAKKKNDWGFVIDRVNMILNGNNDSRNRISVSATIEEDFSKWTPEQLAKAPVAIWESKEYDFDTIRQGESVTFEYKLKNEGKTDLIIRKTKASCGCTAVNTGETVIPPGKATVIKTTFNSRGKKAKQNKTITVITNDPKNSSTLLRISGYVEDSSSTINPPNN